MAYTGTHEKEREKIFLFLFRKFLVVLKSDSVNPDFLLDTPSSRKRYNPSWFAISNTNDQLGSPNYYVNVNHNFRQDQ